MWGWFDQVCESGSQSDWPMSLVASIPLALVLLIFDAADDDPDPFQNVRCVLIDLLYFLMASVMIFSSLSLQ